jgi:hypothetical protein
MPLASLASLLFLLGGLSVQSLGLQGRLQGESQRRQETSEDRLTSAAQMLVAEIQLRHACLLPLPRERWSAAGCATDSELALLAEGTVLGSPWRLRQWQPQGALGADPSQQAIDLQIELAAADGSPALGSDFALRLTGQPWRVSSLLPLGLRGATP